MEEAVGGNYWCHMCSQMVNPILEVEMIKCPFCQSGFIEEMNSTTTTPSRTTRNDHHHLGFGGSDSDRALSLWAPILLGMMSNRHRRRRLRRMVFEEEDDDDDDDEEYEDNNDNHRHRRHHEGETELDRELESLIRRTRRSSASILQLLQEIREERLPDESENNAGENERRDSRENRDRERVILINPFNQTIVLQGSYDSSQPQNQNNPIGSLGDYFVGPGLDMLLQHLADNDLNRYGTAPAQKEAVEALPNVKIKEDLQCSVCLDDFEVGSEAKEMPCNHKFHSACILPWLDLHSSCPVCRHQLPADESKIDSDGGSRNNNVISSGGEEEGDGGGRRFSVPLPWPFSSLFSSSGNGSSSTNAPQSSSHTDHES